ncbi:MAG: 5-formyltetrahydrofolate cyclo-ligase [Gammaproteobacteria bacterium]|nr:5-formyltetrahydrofolate cyclo-ligase [Gammaproteobacteria bacterium]MCY4219010.1 5-formyltetrahydrofolate cyclo-ligase [Gammaproteobacteria bacterium]
MQDKKTIRTVVRRQRQSISQSFQRIAAIGLANQLQSLPEIHRAKNIGVYLASDGEIDLWPSMEWCWNNQIETYVPIVQNQTKILRFAPFGRYTKLIKNRLGILEPEVKKTETLEVGKLDILFMPLVAFDSCGTRLGMGGGFYDSTLHASRDARGSKPLRIGVAHEFQGVEKIESDPWDIPIDRIITDCLIRDFTNLMELN